MKKWTDVGQFRNVVHHVRTKCEYDEKPIPTLMFRGTVKLHGTNAGINRKNGAYTAQGRNVQLFVGEDNYGFAGWLDTNIKYINFKEELDAMFDSISTDDEDDITIFGEWCGKGIQSKVAVSKLPHKMFVVFGASVNGSYVDITTSLDMPHTLSVDNILNSGVYFISVDFTKPEESLQELEKLTLQVEENCPFGVRHHIKDGIGEGLVWTCLEWPGESSLFFKTKGEKHVGSAKTKKVVTVDPETLEKISDVVDYVLSVGRLNQGLEQIDSLDIKNLGNYLKWIGQDIKKEELDTIEANGLEWKDISKRVNETARKFFMEKLDSATFG